MGFVMSSDQSQRLAQLCVEYRVRSLRLFGSATTEEFGEDSDLDFLVDFDAPTPPMRPSTQFFGFREELAKLFARPIDLLEYVAIENKHLRASADASSVMVYAA